MLSLTRYAFASLFLFSALWAPTTAQAQCSTADDDLGGTVFREINANGSVDGVDFALDGTAVPITVNAYDQDTGALLATTSLLADGTYELPALFASATDVRIEFVGLPSFLETSYAAGIDNATAVQFYSAPSCSADLLVHNPADFCGTAEPGIVTNCYIEGDPNESASRAAADTLISGPFTADGTFTPTPGHESRADQIGSTYGIAYQSASGSLFVSAFHKRLAAYGQADTSGAIVSDNGTGAIYIATAPTDDSDADVRLWADFNALYGSNVFGANPHPLGSSQWPNDPGDGLGSSYDAVGKVSFGDIDMAEDQRSLWAVNLADRQLYNIPLGSLTNPTPPASSAAIGRFPLFDLLDCDGDSSLDSASDPDVRPFALKVKDGLVYVGMVCSAESTGAIADLSGHVFSFDPATTNFTEVLSFPLNYDRGCGLADIAGANAGCLLESEWNPWIPTFGLEPTEQVQSTLLPDPPTPAAGFTEFAYPQPMLTDIEFDRAGNLIVGMRDRFGDQMGNGSPDPDGGPAESADGYGDLLIARPSGAMWTISFTENDHPNEFFEDDWDDGSFGHQETLVGGLLIIPAVDELIATIFDPTDGFFGTESLDFSAGTQAWSTITGTVLREWVVYDANDGFGPEDPFGKANGLGDIEAICLPAPLEIGNFVWFDADGDGIQDPEEVPLADVTIELWADTDGDGTVDAQVGTAVTSATGEYLFGGPTDLNLSGSNSLLPGTAYEVRLDLNDTDLPPGAVVTQQNGASGLGDGNDDLRDSDGDDGTLNVGYSTIQLITGAPGENDHTLDFGLNTPVSIGSTIFYDADDNGAQNGAETGIPGVLVQVIDPGPDGIFGSGDDFVAGSDTTDGSGNYFVDGLPPGDYQVVVAAPSTAPTSSTFTDPADNQIDGNDNGDQPGGSGTAAVSPIVSLTSDGEPTDATETFQGNGQDAGDDDNGDMTIDFGFIPIYDVALQKTNATPTSIVPGDAVTFSIVVTNQSGLPVTDVVVTDTIPTGFSLDAASAGTWSGGAGATGNVMTTLAGPIAAGGTDDVTITLRADDPFAPGGGTYENYAEITEFRDAFDGTVQPDQDSDADLGAGNDPNEIDDDISNASADHDDLDPESVTVVVYDVALQKTNATPSSIMPGDPVTFTITVTNQSTAPVTDIVITDTIPAGFSLDATSAGTWSGGAGATGLTTTTLSGPIAAGATDTVTITLVADTPLTDGSYTNYAEVTQFEDAGGTVQTDVDSDTDLGAGNDPNEIDDDIANGSADHDDLDPETVDVGQLWDVALQKSNGSPSSILPGEDVTFTITVTNQSTADVTDVVVTDTIPAGFTLAAARAATGGGGAGAPGVTTTTRPGPLAPG
ncbi:MAG: SdrD B-like domain-containing protein, partial [Acidobacteriota bacterium]